MMTWEQLGIAALCASQVGMWIRGWAAGQQLDRLERGGRVIDVNARDAVLDIRDVRERLPMSPNRADFGMLRDEIRNALAALPKKRTRRARAAAGIADRSAYTNEPPEVTS